MHLTDNEAAERAADRENEYARRNRNNQRLNAVVLGVMAIAVVYYLFPHWSL